MTVKDSFFENNKGNLGSAIYLIGGKNDTKFIIENSSFSNNQVVDKGCIYSMMFSVDIINCIFKGNIAES